MNLLNIRKKRGITQKELADQLDLSITAISQYETGKREPKFETLKKIAKIFDCTVDELI